MKRYFTLFALLSISIAFSSCNKKGCSDPTADNYSENVKKARDNRCEYNGEGICGVNVKFCVDIDGVTHTGGSAQFQSGTKPGDSYKRILWTNGIPFGNAGYEDIIIDIYGNQESSSYSLSNSEANKTFKAEYYSGAFSNAFAATSGKLTIKRDNSSDGLIATFEFTTVNGIELDNGNVYKLK